jgi:pyridinium-3,5-biscarboxylic acid mononucleotide sulfurtransferase
VPSHRTSPSGGTSRAGLSDRLVEEISGYGPTLVAFSGGADSALVLAGAVRALGSDAVAAFTAASASIPAAELLAARSFAATLGIPHHVSGTGELTVEGYQANGRDRCYFCKSTVLDTARHLATSHGYCTVATGINADDLHDPFRPGITAGVQRGVRTPLAAAGLSKADVRRLSRQWGLATWDKPAMPCLASRIAYGVRITPHRLARIERAEAAIRSCCERAGLALRDLRVRDLGHAVRVEVDGPCVAAVRDLPGIDRALATAGFTRDVTIAVEPFRSGNLNTPERPLDHAPRA